jgi:lipopolysaccharide transport system ATP-binding protein
VLFVSHNLAAIRQLCSTSLLLEQGKLKEHGSSELMVGAYLNSQQQIHDAVVETKDITCRTGTGNGRIVQVSFLDTLGRRTTTFGIGKSISVWMRLGLPEGLGGIVAGVEIKHSDGTPLVNLRSDSQGITFRTRFQQSELTIELDIPGLPLYPGRYLVEPWIADRQGRRIDHLCGLLWITLESRGVYASELLIQPERGLILVDCEWRQREAAISTEELVHAH